MSRGRIHLFSFFPFPSPSLATFTFIYPLYKYLVFIICQACVKDTVCSDKENLFCATSLVQTMDWKRSGNKEYSTAKLCG